MEAERVDVIVEFILQKLVSNYGRQFWIFQLYKLANL